MGNASQHSSWLNNIKQAMQHRLLAALCAAAPAQRCCSYAAELDFSVKQACHTAPSDLASSSAQSDALMLTSSCSTNSR